MWKSSLTQIQFTYSFFSRFDVLFTLASTLLACCCGSLWTMLKTLWTESSMYVNVSFSLCKTLNTRFRWWWKSSNNNYKSFVLLRFVYNHTKNNVHQKIWIIRILFFLLSCYFLDTQILNKSNIFYSQCLKWAYLLSFARMNFTVVLGVLLFIGCYEPIGNNIFYIAIM